MTLAILLSLPVPPRMIPDLMICHFENLKTITNPYEKLAEASNR